MPGDRSLAMKRSPAKRISPEIMDEAAEWLMRLNAGLNEREREELHRWQTLSEAHSQAWQRAQLLLHKLDGLPPQISMQALNRLPNPKRRATLKQLLLVLGSVPIGWAALETSESQGWGADFRTAAGERREFRLADGSRITLNTDTAVDTSFDARQRLVIMRHGEILIETATDTATPARDFIVETPDGRLQALGTRFNVRRDSEGHTLVAVFEGAVRVVPLAGREITLQAGEQCSMSPAGVFDRKATHPAALAWTRGILVADEMRLGDFAQEMARYRKGLVRVDPAVANMRISGTYPLDEPERVMAMLSSTYEVEVRTAILGYVVTIVPRQ
jgi:transmembrane sensor